MVQINRSSPAALMSLCALALLAGCADGRASPPAASPTASPSSSSAPAGSPAGASSSSSAPAPGMPAGSSAPAAPAAAPAGVSVEPAVRSAQAWLAQIDAGAYDQSWSSSSKLFRGTVSQANWAIMVARVRTPLGKALSRLLSSSERKTSIPGGPDGQYVIVQFRTGFEHKADAVETITLMAEDDGAFRVSGYFIR